MKNFKNIILTFILVFTIIGVANAEEKYSIKVEAETGNAGSQMSMTFNGLTDLESVYKEDLIYFLKFANDTDPKPTIATLSEINDANDVLDSINSYISVSVEYNEVNKTYKMNSLDVTDDWYMLKGYNKAYVIKCAKDVDNLTYTCQTLEEPIILSKPELPKLTQRYHNFLFTQDEENTLTVFPYFPYDDELGDHELNVKVGLIDNENLLKKLARNDAGSLEELMDYAKKSNGRIFTAKDFEFKSVSVGDFEVINGGYYYMYTYYTNKDGLYRNLDDITVAMGEADMIVNDVDWSKYNTTSLWDEYVEKYKLTDIIKTYTDNNISFDINVTENTLNSIIDDGTIKLVGNFTYKDGVVSYVPLDDKEVPFETIFNEDIIIENVIVALANLKGYDAKKLKTWLYENEGKLSLEKDGIEYTLEDYTKTQDNGVTLTVKKVKSFKFKLDSKLNLESKKVENPKTGISINYKVLLGIILIGAVVYTSIRKRSKFPKHN